MQYFGKRFTKIYPVENPGSTPFRCKFSKFQWLTAAINLLVSVCRGTVLIVTVAISILGPEIHNFIRLVIPIKVQTSVIETLRMSLPDEYVCIREYRNKTMVDSMTTESILQSLLVENEGNCVVRCLRYHILHMVNIFDFLGYTISSMWK